MGWVFMFAFWGGLIALAVWAVSRFTQRPSSGPPPQRPLDIAKTRYARGEISKEEFERLKKDLS